MKHNTTWYKSYKGEDNIVIILRVKISLEKLSLFKWDKLCSDGFQFLK